MKRRTSVRVVLMCWAFIALPGGASALEIVFKQATVDPKGRIDAVAYMGKGVVAAHDFITCLQAGGDGVCYLLTGRKAHVWKTTDYGETWTDLGRVSSAANSAEFANAYGMAVSPKGTVLVADADDEGGQIHRSTDGGASWQPIRRISPHPLYRLNVIRDGIIVNGWAGDVYKSKDDGRTWADAGRLSASPLYAIEHVEGDGTVLIGAANGEVFRSRDNCLTWTNVGKVRDSADDFAWLGRGRVLYSTYDGSRELYVSEDAGASWDKGGTVSTEPGDWLDHFISFEKDGLKRIVGGTNKGFIVYADVPE